VITLPRHDIATQSELLQAKLYQPAIMTPFSPTPARDTLSSAPSTRTTPQTCG